MNNVSLVGNLTKSPELRTTSSGISTCTFTIAVNRIRSKEGAQQADFIQIVTWRNTAENCARYLEKGRKVGITGRIQSRTYDAQDGSKRYVTEVIAENVEFLSPSNQRQDDAGQHAAQPASGGGSDYADAGFTEVDDDELPF